MDRALACFRGFPAAKIAPYCLAQIVGGFLGAALTYSFEIAVLAIVQVISRALTHGLMRPARELLFTVVDLRRVEALAELTRA